MTRRLSPSALKLATLLRDLNPDIKFAPAFERALGKKKRTVDVTLPALQVGKTEAMRREDALLEISLKELDADIGTVYPDLPGRG